LVALLLLLEEDIWVKLAPPAAPIGAIGAMGAIGVIGAMDPDTWLVVVLLLDDDMEDCIWVELVPMAPAQAAATWATAPGAMGWVGAGAMGAGGAGDLLASPVPRALVELAKSVLAMAEDCWDHWTELVLLVASSPAFMTEPEDWPNSLAKERGLGLALALELVLMTVSRPPSPI